MYTPPTNWRKHQKQSHWLGQKGHIVQFSKIHVAAEGRLGKTPYTIALIHFPKLKQTELFELCENPGEKQVQVGTQVQLIWRKVKQENSGLTTYGLKAKLC